MHRLALRRAAILCRQVDLDTRKFTQPRQQILSNDIAIERRIDDGFIERHTEQREQWFGNGRAVFPGDHFDLDLSDGIARPA